MTRPTIEELRAQMPVSGTGKRRGLYAAPPGTGPAGQTCGDCAFLRFTGNVKRYPKCGKVKYTHGDATTIRMKSPACRHFELEAPQ